MRTILVSGASGIVGYGVLRSLRKVDPTLRLVGTTIYCDSPAQAFCDIFELAPPTKDAGYAAWLAAVIARHAVDLIVPGIEADMYRWLEIERELTAASPVKVLLNDRALVALCRDKWVFYEEVAKSARPWVIQSTLDTDFDVLAGKLGVPFLLKPRIGFASKGHVKVDSRDVFHAHRERVGPVLMAQPIVGSEDEEFTTSAFCDGRGGVLAHMTLRRKLSPEGFTDRADVVAAPDVDDAVRELCAIFKPVGPTNFQFRRHTGGVKLLEINPRISSATSIRTAFGYNESAMSVEYFLDGKVPIQPAVRAGRAVRYVEDLVFYS